MSEKLTDHKAFKPLYLNQHYFIFGNIYNVHLNSKIRMKNYAHNLLVFT